MLSALLIRKILALKIGSPDRTVGELARLSATTNLPPIEAIAASARAHNSEIGIKIGSCATKSRMPSSPIQMCRKNPGAGSSSTEHKGTIGVIRPSRASPLISQMILARTSAELEEALTVQIVRNIPKSNSSASGKTSFRCGATTLYPPWS